MCLIDIGSGVSRAHFIIFHPRVRTCRGGSKNKRLSFDKLHRVGDTAHYKWGKGCALSDFFNSLALSIKNLTVTGLCVSCVARLNYLLKGFVLAAFKPPHRTFVLHLARISSFCPMRRVHGDEADFDLHKNICGD